MGAIIRASAASLEPKIYSSIVHASIAGKKCLNSADIPIEDVGLIFNVGVYRDSNMLEPAMAALIQKELGINLDYLKSAGKKPTAAFDIMNGACGVLNAAQVASAFLATNSAQFALIVSSDVHPSMRYVEEFPYANLGAAMLLEWSEDPFKGFGRFQFRASPASLWGSRSYVKMPAENARESMTIEQHPEYAEMLLEFLNTSIMEYIAAEKIILSDTLLITPQINHEFPRSIAKKLAISETSVVTIPQDLCDPHSSAMTLGYCQALLAGKNKQHKQILFVAGGAGLTSACVVYRQ